MTHASSSFFDDTIVAISTAAGRGALGIIRISGPRALPLLKQFTWQKSDGCRQTPAYDAYPRRSFYITVVDSQDQELDDGMGTFYPAPHSYTGEDTAELTLHGNPLILRTVVATMILTDGVRPADPGEYTKRAYLSGKMDLTQAEAVRRIIEGRSEYEIQLARNNLHGELRGRIERLRQDLVSLKAETEAEIDFSTEDLTFESRDVRKAKIKQIIEDIYSIEKKSKNTQRVVSGLQIALAGIPNAGKSSLMNRILGWDRSIVSELPGTTRDYLVEELQIDGYPVRFIDTAGLRESEDQIEQEGVRRTLEELKRSDLILHLIDGSIPEYESAIPDDLDKSHVIHVINKVDRLHESRKVDAAVPGTSSGSAGSGSEKLENPQGLDAITGEQTVTISCKENKGIEHLHSIIHRRLFSETEQQHPFLLEERHLYHYARIRTALERVLQLWETNAPDEITGIELDTALEHAGEITGKIDTEEILGQIFSTFCVGK